MSKAEYPKLWERIKNVFVPKTDTVYYNDALRTLSANKRKSAAQGEHFVSRSAIILNKWYHIDNAEHREMVYRYNELAKSCIDRVTESICKNPLKFLIPGKEKDEEPKEHIDCKEFWDENELQNMLKAFIKECRKHGSAIYHPDEQELKVPWDQQPQWRVYSWLQIQNVVSDALGRAVKWKIKYTRFEKDIDKNFDFSKCVYFDPHETIDGKGISSLEVIWDSIIAYEGILDSMQAFDQRLGNGFMVVAVAEDLGEKIKGELKNTIKNVRTEKGLILDNVGEKGASVDWMNPGQGNRFVEDLEKIEDKVAWGLGLPLMWLKGNRLGGVTGAEEDRKTVYEMLKAIAQPYMNFVKKVLLFHGIIDAMTDVVVEPDVSVDVSDSEKAELENLKTSTIGMKSWATLEEKRKLDGMKKLKAGEKTEEDKLTDLVGDLQQLNQNMNPMQEASSPLPNDKTKTAAAKTDSVDDFFRKTPIRVLTNMLPISKGSVEKLRAQFDQDYQVKPKEYNLMMKTDSLDIQNNIVQGKGVILAPAELGYDKHTEIMEKEEIVKWYESKAPKEFYLGVEVAPEHNNSTEVLKAMSIGTVKATDMDYDTGEVFGEYQYDLQEVDKWLGRDNNWVRDYIKKQKPIPSSVGLWSRDKRREGNIFRTNLDVRSFVLTETPRNKKTTFEVK